MLTDTGPFDIPPTREAHLPPDKWPRYRGHYAKPSEARHRRAWLRALKRRLAESKARRTSRCTRPRHSKAAIVYGFCCGEPSPLFCGAGVLAFEGISERIRIIDRAVALGHALPMQSAGDFERDRVRSKKERVSRERRQGYRKLPRL